jgi:hypothetical protein
MPHALCPMPHALAEESRQRGHIVKILRILAQPAIQSDKLLSVDLRCSFGARTVRVKKL